MLFFELAILNKFRIQDILQVFKKRQKLKHRKFNSLFPEPLKIPNFIRDFLFAHLPQVVEKKNPHCNGKKATENRQMDIIIGKKGKSDPESHALIKNKDFCGCKGQQENPHKAFWNFQQFEIGQKT